MCVAMTSCTRRAKKKTKRAVDYTFLMVFGLIDMFLSSSVEQKKYFNPKI